MTGFSETTAPPYEPPITKAEFYAWVERQPQGRFELKDGRIVQQMTGATKAHNRIVSNFIFALGARLDRDIWSITASDLAVEIGDDIRYPDLVVERLDSPGPPLTAEHAVVLLEVLSPSSVKTDRQEKAAEYTSLASLGAYIIASQDEAKCWLWQRDRATHAFPAQPVEVTGQTAMITLDGLGVSLPLAELFRGVLTAKGA